MINRKQLFIASAALLGAVAQAQDIYAGVGFPNRYALGYAHPMGDKWGLRGEYAGGTKLSQSGTSEGVNYDAEFKSSRAGLFGDWFPFGGGFRFVGGITANDTKLDMAVRGTSAKINNNTVNLSGYYMNVNIKYAPVTPYLGIGYGHHKADKGLGFFFDLGVTYGSWKADITSNLVGATATDSNGNTVTLKQSDLDAQAQKLTDALGGYGIVPSASVGLVYRF